VREAGDLVYRVAAFFVVDPRDGRVGKGGGDAYAFACDVAVSLVFEVFDVGVDSVVVQGDAVYDVQVRAEPLR
jgi:hypothetical protein